MTLEFVDTEVLFHVCNSTRGRETETARIIVSRQTAAQQGCVSAQTPQEF
jgi:hypothetical protein